MRIVSVRYSVVRSFFLLFLMTCFCPVWPRRENQVKSADRRRHLPALLPVSRSSRVGRGDWTNSGSSRSRSAKFISCAVRTMAPDIFQTSIFQSAATRCHKFACLTFLLLFLLVLRFLLLFLPLLLYILQFHSDFLTLTFLVNGSLLCSCRNEFVKGQSFYFQEFSYSSVYRSVPFCKSSVLELTLTLKPDICLPAAIKFRWSSSTQFDIGSFGSSLFWPVWEEAACKRDLICGQFNTFNQYFSSNTSSFIIACVRTLTSGRHLYYKGNFFLSLFLSLFFFLVFFFNIFFSCSFFPFISVFFLRLPLFLFFLLFLFSLNFIFNFFSCVSLSSFCLF